MYSVSDHSCFVHTMSMLGYHITSHLTSLIPILPQSHAWRASLGPLPCHFDKEVSEPGVLQAITQGETPLEVSVFVRRWCQIPGLPDQHVLLTIRLLSGLGTLPLPFSNKGMLIHLSKPRQPYKWKKTYSLHIITQLLLLTAGSR